MNLCRFSLRDDPETVRSGIFHEQRVYETQGTQALGVYELSKIILLPPVPQPPSVKVFDRHEDGTWMYQHRSPHFLMGPLAEFDLPIAVTSLDFNVRVAAVTKDGGAQIEKHEAEEFLIGYSIYIEFFREELLSAGHKFDGMTYALPFGLGPFLTTTDMVLGTPEEAIEEWNIVVKVNGEEVYQETQAPYNLSDFLVQASQGISILPGEVICGPPINKPLLKETSLGRSLVPEDTIQIIHSRIGALTLKIV